LVLDGPAGIGKTGAPAVLLVSANGTADGAAGKACGARDLISKAELAHVDLRSIWA
jgi:hypothetical protein